MVQVQQDQAQCPVIAFMVSQVIIGEAQRPELAYPARVVHRSDFSEDDDDELHRSNWQYSHA
jgi:hypothetical protein